MFIFVPFRSFLFCFLAVFLLFFLFCEHFSTLMCYVLCKGYFTRCVMEK